MAKPHALAALPEPDRTPPDPQPQTGHELQAAAEGTVHSDRIEFMGESYRVADKVGAIPYMRFAKAAERGANVEDMAGMAAVYDMLRDVFVLTPPCSVCDACKAGEDCPLEDLGDWPRFEADATRKKADAEEVIGAVTQAIQIMGARPTRRALRLLGWAVDNYAELDGILVLAGYPGWEGDREGVDGRRSGETGGGLSLRRLLNVIYAHLVAGADGEAREKFDRDLYAPLQGWDAVQRRIVELVREAD